MSNPKIIYWSSILSLRSISFTTMGVLFAVLGLQGFMLPNNFLDGGVTGISILILGYSDINISLLLVALNIPFVIIGFYKIGRTFAIQAMTAVLMLSAGMYFIEFEVFTNDKVLIAVFGGFFIGLGIGLVIRGGGIIDGLEVIAQYTEKRSAFSSAEIILLLNTLTILGAAYRFGIETGMYSILVYYTAMKTTNYVVDGFEEYTSLSVISKNSVQIQKEIVEQFRKGITLYKGERGFLPDSYEKNANCDIIMTIVSRLEVHRIKKAIHVLDPEAFIFVNSIKEMAGSFQREQRKKGMDGSGGEVIRMKKTGTANHILLKNLKSNRS